MPEPSAPLATHVSEDVPLELRKAGMAPTPCDSADGAPEPPTQATGCCSSAAEAPVIAMAGSATDTRSAPGCDAVHARATARWPATAGQRFSQPLSCAAGRESERTSAPADAFSAARKADALGCESTTTASAYGTGEPVDVCVGDGDRVDDALEPGDAVPVAVAACEGDPLAEGVSVPVAVGATLAVPDVVTDCEGIRVVVGLRLRVPVSEPVAERVPERDGVREGPGDDGRCSAAE